MQHTTLDFPFLKVVFAEASFMSLVGVLVALSLVAFIVGIPNGSSKTNFNMQNGLSLVTDCFLGSGGVGESSGNGTSSVLNWCGLLIHFHDLST